jgi:hypothetical protein
MMRHRLLAPAGAVALVAVAALGAATVLRPPAAGGNPSPGAPGSMDPRAVAAAGGRLYVAGGSFGNYPPTGVVESSADGGATWSSTRLDAPAFRRAVPDGSSVWLAADCQGPGSGCLFHGDASGWRAVDSPPLDDMLVAPAGTLSAITHAAHVAPRLRQTFDGGASWHDVANPCPDGRVPLVIAGRSQLDVVACGVWLSNEGWVALDDWIMVQRDGQAWRTIATSTTQTVEDLAAYNPGPITLTGDLTGWMQANGHLYQTGDGGLSWSEVVIDPTNALSVASVADAGPPSAYTILRTEGATSRLLLGDAAAGWKTVASWPWSWEGS